MARRSLRRSRTELLRLPPARTALAPPSREMQPKQKAEISPGEPRLSQAVGVTPFGLALVGAEDRADFQRRLLSGDGPGARQLRHLASTLTIAGAPRLERIRRLTASRAASLNVRCFRIAAADGAVFLILTADDADSAGAAAPGAVKTREPAASAGATAPQPEAHRRRRFSGAWTGTNASAPRILRSSLRWEPPRRRPPRPSRPHAAALSLKTPTHSPPPCRCGKRSRA